MQDIEKIVKQGLDTINAADSVAALEQLRVDFLGKKGLLTELLKSLGNASPEQRPILGQAVNDGKQLLQQALQERQSALKELVLNAKIAEEVIDVTLAGRQQQQQGGLHPITLTRQRVENLLTQMGFVAVEGPEVESQYYNFSALNMPEHHPARAMHDTFYFADGRILRTHTSPGQIRYMEQKKPPIRMISIGRVYRCDSDVTHTPMFHQVEGLMIDEQTSFADLKGLLQEFIQRFFERPLAMRFRPSYFPFTEPSAEADMECTQCAGKGCRVCSYTGWLEILGCGMVHPNVLKAGNIDSDKYQGFAFGLGIDRLTMLRYGIDDLRLLFSNDLRLLQQFIG